MEKTLVFLGDSITDCDRLWDVRDDGLGFGYVRKIKEGLSAGEPLKLYNRGHNRFTAFQVREWLSEDLSGLSPDVVSLLVGINDLAGYLYGGGYGAEEFERQIQKILERLLEKGRPRLILMEPFVFPVPAAYRAWEEPLARFREKVRSVAGRAGAGFVPLWEIFREAMEDCPPRELTTDGIHLTERGHEILAAAWRKEFYR